MTTVRAALSGGPWLVALWLIGHVLAGRPAPASAAPPSDVLADCARRYAVEAVIAVCTDRQEAAQERLSQRVDIEPALRAACDEVSDTWTSLEVCIARVRQTQYTWALWSFGGEYAGRLFRGQDWQVIALGFDSPEACEDAIAGHLNALNATVLLIDRVRRINRSCACRRSARAARSLRRYLREWPHVRLDASLPAREYESARRIALTAALPSRARDDATTTGFDDRRAALARLGRDGLRSVRVGVVAGIPRIR